MGHISTCGSWEISRWSGSCDIHIAGLDPKISICESWTSQGSPSIKRYLRQSEDMAVDTLIESVA